MFQNVDPANWQIKDGCKPENVLGEKVIKELLKEHCCENILFYRIMTIIRCKGKDKAKYLKVQAC